MAALAIKIKFVDNELFDDDVNVSKMIASSFNTDELPSLAQAQSDPIHGSLGAPVHNPEDFSDEVAFEIKMRSYKKPQRMVVDDESIKSLAWAE